MTKAFSLRRRCESEVGCGGVAEKNFIINRCFIFYTTSVTFGDRFSSRRSLYCNPGFSVL
jgi:hypothetical protein